MPNGDVSVKETMPSLASDEHRKKLAEEMLRGESELT
jgi:hypothetical protein